MARLVLRVRIAHCSSCLIALSRAVGTGQMNNPTVQSTIYQKLLTGDIGSVLHFIPLQNAVALRSHERMPKVGELDGRIGEPSK